MHIIKAMPWGIIMEGLVVLLLTAIFYYFAIPYIIREVKSLLKGEPK